jgi:hypothetical protein
MSIAAAWPQCLAFFGTPLVIETSPWQLSSDAGLLPRPVRPAQGPQDFTDARDPNHTEKRVLEEIARLSSHPGKSSHER